MALQFPNEYSDLCGDNVTTFDSEEKVLSKIYKDVWTYDDREREEAKQSLNITKDMKKTATHPSKEFILAGGLKQIVKEARQ